MQPAKNTGLLAVLVLQIFWSSSLRAQIGTVWSSPAMACVPTGTTAEQARYITTAGGVKFKDGASGSISFICPVSVPLPDGPYVLGGLVDLTSRTPPAELSFLLRRANKTTGAVETLIGSNSVRWDPGPNTRFVHVESANSTPIDFDFDTFVYWVQMTNESPNLSILAVELRRRPR
jgi:hypothetical protein